MMKTLRQQSSEHGDVKPSAQVTRTALPMRTSLHDDAERHPLLVTVSYRADALLSVERSHQSHQQATTKYTGRHE